MSLRGCKILLYVILRELKNGLMFLILYAFDTLPALSTRTIAPRSLLIVRTDALGDYILFRNSLKKVRVDPIYKNWRITLVCNQAHRELVERLDVGLVDNIIWVDRGRLRANLTYRLSILSQVRKTGFERCWIPAFGNSYDTDLVFARISGAMDTWAVVGYSPNLPWWQRQLCKPWINHPIRSQGRITFELERNAEILSAFLGRIVALDSSMGMPDLVDEFGLGDYVVFQIQSGGARINRLIRDWSPSKFGALARILLQNTHLKLVYMGVASAHCAVELATRGLPADRVVDLTGKTSLTQYVSILSRAKYVVSVDTSTVHLSAALKVPCVCISNGFHYQRFTDYPDPWSAFIHHIYPRGIDLTSPVKYRFVSMVNIDRIDPKEVWSEMAGLIKTSG